MAVQVHTGRIECVEFELGTTKGKVSVVSDSLGRLESDLLSVSCSVETLGKRSEDVARRMTELKGAFSRMRDDTNQRFGTIHDVMTKHSTSIKKNTERGSVVENGLKAQVEQAKVERVKLETVKDLAANSASRISQVRREFKTCVTALYDTPQEIQVLTSPFDGASFGATARGLRALKQWTEKNYTAFVYDSAFDEFSVDGLFDKIKGKENVAVVAWMTQGDVFGGVYHNAMTEINENEIVQDMFIFSFESRGRCQTPQQFRLRNTLNDEAFVRFSNCDTDGSFMTFWVSGCGVLSWE